MKKIIAICLVFIICLSFSACDFSINTIDNLMRPPKLSGESSLLQIAFENSLENSDSIVMKNPISGDSRSSFLFYDIDSDNVQEAFAFYSDPAISEIAYFSIFKMNNNDWIQVANVKGRGEEIYEIDFADLNGDGILEILISWTFLSDVEKNTNNSFSKTSDRVLTIYNYSDEGVNLLKAEYFTKIFVDDFNNDKSDEILLININHSNLSSRTTARILRFDNDYQVNTDKNLILSSMINIYNIATDNADGHTRIFIDGSINENTFITELIDIKQDDFQISLPLYEMNTSDSPLTLRDSQIYSFDVDNDGVVEIPTKEIWPNAVNIANNMDESTPLSLTVWSEISDGGIVTDFKCLYNVSYNYFYVISDDWIDTVAASYNDNDSLLSFYEILPDGTKNHIISFKLFNSNEWRNYSGKYTKISEDGIFVYAYMFNDDSGYNETNLLKNFVIVN